MWRTRTVKYWEKYGPKDKGIVYMSYPKSEENKCALYDCFKKKGLHSTHFNARSLLPKLAEVCTLVVEFNAAIVCVTETWLDDSLMDSEIELSGYVVQRKDRERSGGGVCMYIRSDLAFNPRPELSTDQLETLWIKIILPKTKPVCYRPLTKMTSTNYSNFLLLTFP